MNRRWSLVTAALACASGSAQAAPAPTMSDPENQPILLTVEVEPASQNFARLAVPQISPVLYMNRCEGGCAIAAGEDDDARDNTSSIPDEDTELSEFEHGDAVWNDTVDCVREVLSPYDIAVVTTDPGGDSHHEAIVAGTADELGLPRPSEGEIGGVAPLASDCRPLDNAMSFTFANTLADSVTDLCWTVVHESGHSFGLDHAYDCSDPMTYIPGCGTKYFRDAQLPCGEFEERSCQCGGTTQNSHGHLVGVFGEGERPAPPEVEIANLRDGDEIDEGAEVAFVASHVRGVRRVALRVNGTRYGEVAGNGQGGDDSYRLALPRYPDGVMRVEAVAYNDLGVEGSDTVTVAKGEPCERDEDCYSGMACDDGACRYPPPFLELGEPCERDRECISGLCPSAGDERYCSQICEPGLGECPGSLVCREAGDRGACWPEGAGAGCGGCRADRSNVASSALSFALVLLAGFVTAGRRKRSSS